MSSDSEAQEAQEEEPKTHREASRRRRREECLLEHTMRRRVRGSPPLLRAAIPGTAYTVVQLSPRPLLISERAVSVSECACLFLFFFYFFLCFTFLLARCRAAELEEMDKMLLAKSAITGDEQLKKMYKRQSELRKKLAAYRAERLQAQHMNAQEELRLKAVMQAEKAK